MSAAELFAVLSERIADDLKDIEAQRAALTKERADFEAEKKAMVKMLVKGGDIIKLDVGGEPVNVSGRWEDRLERDEETGKVFLEVNPYCFKKIIDFLRSKTIETPERPAVCPQIASDMVDEFEALCEYYGMLEAIKPKPKSILHGLTLTQPNGGIYINNLSFNYQNGNGNWCAVVSSIPLPTDRVSQWAVDVGVNCSAFTAGVVGKANPPQHSYTDATSYTWYTTSGFYQAGESDVGDEDAFHAGDHIALRFSPSSRTLTLANRRTGQRFNRQLPSTGPWFIHFSLHPISTIASTIVEPTTADIALLG